MTIPLSRAMRSQLRADGRAARAGVRGDDRDDHRRAGEGEPPGGHEPVAAVVAGPAQDDDRPAPPAVEVVASARTAAATAVPACSISRTLGIPERLRAPVGAGHRLRPRSAGRPPGRPVPAQPAQVHLEDGRVVGGQRRSGVGGRRVSSDGHRPRSVAEVRAWAGVPEAPRRCEPGLRLFPPFGPLSAGHTRAR